MAERKHPKFAVSQAVYGWLLRAYPAAHRAEYGAAMAQLFNDQCRTAWEKSGRWGLVGLWSRVLPDLVSTSLRERWEALTERKTMNEKISNVGRSTGVAPVFISVFLTVFLMMAIAGTAVTFLLPESYASTARVKIPAAVSPGTIQPPTYDPYAMQSNIELVASDKVLDPVISQTDLNKVWGKKFNNGDPFRTDETRVILKSRLEVRPVKNSMSVDISIYSDDSHEAAILANAIAGSYQGYLATSGMVAAGSRVDIVTQAEPGRVPVRPNKPLNITISCVFGMVVGAGVAMAASVMAARVGRRRRAVV